MVVDIQIEGYSILCFNHIAACAFKVPYCRTSINKGTHMRLINIHTSTCTKPVHWYCVSNVVMQSKCTIEYRRTGFNCENLIIANYEFF